MGWYGEMEGKKSLQRLRVQQESGTAGEQVDHGWSQTEREVLRVLWANPGEPLVRSEIHRRMPRTGRPTLGRVGQILAALYGNQLLDRECHRSQGSTKAGFYTLSERGRRLCQAHGFEREDRLLFQVTEEELRTSLTRERLVGRSEVPGHIVAVYGYRGGLGRTTLAAHLGRGLAERSGDREPLLVIDLDLGAPGLDAFFQAEKQSRCRGLGGLAVDYRRQTAHKRTLWLFGALSAPEYVLRPLAEVPNLVYLPSGLSPGQGSLSLSERAEALALLQAEAGLPTPSGRSEADLKDLGFLPELRATVLEKFSRTVVDPEPGHSLGAWVATQALADQLMVCTQTGDDSPATLLGLRAVLASFLQRCTGSDSCGVQFVFRLTELAPEEDLNRWIDDHMAAHHGSESKGAAYWTRRLPNEARFASKGLRWYPDLYQHLLDGLERPTADLSQPTISANATLQLLVDVLDPEKDSNDRLIAAGALKRCPLQELATWVDWYNREKSFHRSTDEQGQSLIKDIMQVQSDRFLSKILTPRGHPDGSKYRSE